MLNFLFYVGSAAYLGAMLHLLFSFALFN